MRLSVSRVQLAAALALGSALGCAKPLPPAFAQARDEAQRARARGDDRTAAEHWARAAALAPNARERDEARYRRAASMEAAGLFAEADGVYAGLERSSGERAARAAFARAALAEKQGRPAEGARLLHAALLRHPNSGLARRAATRWLAEVEQREGPEAALERAAALADRLRGSELEETLRYFWAQRLERQGDKARALAAYLDIVRRFPYPHGAHWDDAALGAARLEERLGRPLRAIQHLERMLGQREIARISGSYERPTFAQARFRIAELYRDRVGDPTRAMAHFRRVGRDHPTSLLVDDALFEAALLARRTGDLGEACRAAEHLLEAAPDSRFARCASELCTHLPSRKDCRPYVQRRIDAALRGTADDHSSSSSR